MTGGYFGKQAPKERRAFFAVERRLETMEDALDALQPTPWTNVTYENSWVDYGGGLPGVQYRKVGDMVQIRGFAKNGTMAAPMFTLPVGFRPPATLNLTIEQGSVGAGLATVYSSGVVVSVSFYGGTNAVAGFSAQFSVTP